MENKLENKIGRLSSITKKWTVVGELKTARKIHNAIFYDDHFVVIGGYVSKGVSLPTEKCLLANDQVTCKSQTPDLYDYGFAETFIVPFDFCQ